MVDQSSHPTESEKSPRPSLRLSRVWWFGSYSLALLLRRPRQSLRFALVVLLFIIEIALTYGGVLRGEEELLQQPT